jgi:hypothetical protein
MRASLGIDRVSSGQAKEAPARLGSPAPSRSQPVRPQNGDRRRPIPCHFPAGPFRILEIR